jgi:hypothetical protein
MDTITLNIWERLYLIQVSNNLPQVFPGLTAYDYRKLMKFQGVMELPDDEAEDIGLKSFRGGFRWNPEIDRSYELQLTRNDNEILDKCVVVLKQGPVPPDRPERIVALCDKLGVFKEEEDGAGTDA